MKILLVIFVIIAIIYYLIHISFFSKLVTFCILILPLLAIASLIIPFLKIFIKVDIIIILILIGAGVFKSLFFNNDF